MFENFKSYFWALKLGAIVNLYFLSRTLVPPVVFKEAQIIVPAQILFAVSAYRCFFPVRYDRNIVFHNSFFSSIFITRFLATFAEVAMIYQLAYLIRVLNFNQVGWVDVLSWYMVVQAVVSQCFVWAAILAERRILYFYEEIGWALIYGVNTISSIYLYTTVSSFGGRELLIQINFLFGVVYLPWQFIHLRVLRSNARGMELEKEIQPRITIDLLMKGLQKSIRIKNRTSDAQEWGGLVGVIWMTSYWATLIPFWVYLVVRYS